MISTLNRNLSFFLRYLFLQYCSISRLCKFFLYIIKLSIAPEYSSRHSTCRLSWWLIFLFNKWDFVVVSPSLNSVIFYFIFHQFNTFHLRLFLRNIKRHWRGVHFRELAKVILCQYIFIYSRIVRRSVHSAFTRSSFSISNRTMLTHIFWHLSCKSASWFFRVTLRFILNVALLFFSLESIGTWIRVFKGLWMGRLLMRNCGFGGDGGSVEVTLKNLAVIQASYFIHIFKH